jgi:hypothetical protein
MKPTPFFFVRITNGHRPWPFRWGPFGRKPRERIVKLHDGYIGIFQREGAGVTEKPLLIECFVDSMQSSCTTTVFFQESARLRRRTGVQS